MISSVNDVLIADDVVILYNIVLNRNILDANVPASIAVCEARSFVGGSIRRVFRVRFWCIDVSKKGFEYSNRILLQKFVRVLIHSKRHPKTDGCLTVFLKPTRTLSSLLLIYYRSKEQRTHQMQY